MQSKNEKLELKLSKFNKNKKSFNSLRSSTNCNPNKFYDLNKIIDDKECDQMTDQAIEETQQDFKFRDYEQSKRVNKQITNTIKKSSHNVDSNISDQMKNNNESSEHLSYISSYINRYNLNSTSYKSSYNTASKRKTFKYSDHQVKNHEELSENINNYINDKNIQTYETQSNNLKNHSYIINLESSNGQLIEQSLIDDRDIFDDEVRNNTNDLKQDDDVQTTNDNVQYGVQYIKANLSAGYQKLLNRKKENHKSNFI